MAFALSIYGLVIFSGMLGYIEIGVVDTFEQIQHGSNPSLAVIMVFRSTWVTSKINGVAIDLFCTGVIGHP